MTGKFNQDRKGLVEHRDAQIIVIGQGEYAVSSNPKVVISTILGSCIATCIWDAEAKIGGMNHILLPEDSPSRTEAHGYAAMEVLVNELVKVGAVKHRMRAKIFGGAQMIEGLSNIGALNIAVARRFILEERISRDVECVGGQMARRVQFRPVDGSARQKRIADYAELPRRQLPAMNGVELF